MTTNDEQPRLKGRLGRPGRPGAPVPPTPPPGPPPSAAPGGLPPASTTPPGPSTAPGRGVSGGPRFGRIEPGGPPAPATPSAPPSPGSPWAPPSAPPAEGPWAPATEGPPAPGGWAAPGADADPTSLLAHPVADPAAPAGDAGTGEGAAAPGSGGGGRGKRVRLVAVVAGVAILGVVGFLVQRALRGDAGGASSPEAAAQQLVDALNAEDPVAAAAVIDPDEVHTLGELVHSVEERFAEAKIDSKPGEAAGFDLSVENVRFRTKELGDGFAEVEISSGRARWSIEPDELAERTKAADVEADSDTVDRRDLVVTGENDRGSYEIDPHLIAVKKGSGWYISLAHTVASYLAEANDLPGGDHRAEPPADLAAADSPEDAVVALLETAGDLDAETTLESLPTDEWGVLWVYRDAIEEFVDREQPDDFSVTVDAHDVEVSDLSGGYKKVTIKGAEGSLRYTDDYDGPTQTDWELDGWCMRSDGDRTCLDDDAFVLTDPGTYGIELPFVVVTQERGGWVVSPNATLVEYGKAIAAKTTPEMLYRWIGPEHVAPPDGTLTLGKAVTATLNSGAYARYDIELTEGQHVVVPEVDDDDLSVSLHDPDGRELWDRVIDVEETGTYRLIAWGLQAGQEVGLLVDEVPVTTIDGATARGALTAERPVVDFSFQVPESGPWTISGEGDVDWQVLAADRETWVDGFDHCYSGSACGLAVGETYYLRVSRYYYGDADGSTSFSLDLVPGATTSIDGSTSVEDHVSGGSNYHDVEVGPGVTATITLEGDYSAGDLDLACEGLGCSGSARGGSYEEVTVEGPASGQVRVYGYSGATGGYTLSISSD